MTLLQFIDTVRVQSGTGGSGSPGKKKRIFFTATGRVHGPDGPPGRRGLFPKGQDHATYKNKVRSSRSNDVSAVLWFKASRFFPAMFHMQTAVDVHKRRVFM